MEGSWEGIAGCVVHVDVHGECVCCLVVGGCKLLTKGCSWLAVVHGYEVSLNALLKKADVSTTILQSSSEHTQRAQNTAVYALMKAAE